MAGNEEVTRESTQVSDSAPAEQKTEQTVDKSDVGAKAERSKSFRTDLRTKLRGKEDSNPKAAAAEAPKTVSPAVAAPSNAPEAVAAGPEVIMPPADMSKEDKEDFAKASPAMQKYISRRAYETRRDYTQKTEAVAQKERELGDLYQVVTPELRNEYAKQGIGVPDLVRRSVAWDKAFKANPLQAAREYLEAYGVNINELATSTESQEPPKEYLTREEALELAREEYQKQHQQIQQQSVAAESHSALQSFIASKPVFKDPGTASQIESIMAPVLHGLRTANPGAPAKDLLEQAYTMALAHPTLSGLASQLNARQVAEQQTAEAQKAIAASRSIRGGPGQGTPKLKAQNFREGLRLRMSGAR